MNGAERLRQQGREQSLRSVLTKQLSIRFGDQLPDYVTDQIQAASSDLLERWTERFAQFDTLEQVLS